MLHSLASVITVALLTGASLHGAQAAPADRDTVMALARAGRAADAWKVWDAMPPGPARLRVGVTLSAATHQLARGLDLYDALTRETGGPDRQALTELALSVAEDTAAAADPDARLDACAAALVLDAKHATCRRVLNDASQSRDVDEQARGVYALANAGLRPSPAVMSSLAAAMSRPTRLQLARRMTRLTGAQRLALLQPLLNDPDVSTQYETVLTAIEIPGPEVADALARVDGTPLAPPVKIAVTLARARHGDKSRLAAVADLLPSLSGFERIIAAGVLASANDKRGIDVLNEMLKSRVDIERLQAAAALADVNPKAARAVLVETVRGGSPAIRQTALLSAGALELGTDPAIYRRLTDGVAPIRAAAVEAIATTFWNQDHRVQPPRAQ